MRRRCIIRMGKVGPFLLSLPDCAGLHFSGQEPELYSRALLWFPWGKMLTTAIAGWRGGVDAHCEMQLWKVHHLNNLIWWGATSPWQWDWNGVGFKVPSNPTIL